MELTEKDIATLILKRLRRQQTEAEDLQLERWRQISEVNRKKYLELTDFYALQLKLWNYSEASQRADQFRLPELPALKAGRSHFMLSRIGWVAASIITLLGLGVWLYYQQSKPVSKPEIAIQKLKDILAPSTNRATITLDDGSQVFLDSVDNGQLAQLGNVKLVKLANGQIAYQAASGEILKELQYNTLANPRGSKVINMTLADGSKVWLNAGSSITYPVTFTEHERRVELKGEGYFEVAKDKTRKFIVLSNWVTTEVLGTHFNVNAYNNEPAIKVTLLEGSVRTVNDNGSVVIKPGQQAVAESRNLKVNESPNLDQVLAWKNGLFNVNHLPITEVMKQIANWYDVEVTYPDGIPKVELFGKMGRDLRLSEVLQSLEEMGVRCRLDGRRLIVN